MIIKYGRYAYIFAEKRKMSSTHSFNKNTCELVTVLTRTGNILTTNELVKLTMFWPYVFYFTNNDKIYKICPWKKKRT